MTPHEKRSLRSARAAKFCTGRKRTGHTLLYLKAPEEGQRPGEGPSKDVEAPGCRAAGELAV